MPAGSFMHWKRREDIALSLPDVPLGEAWTMNPAVSLGNPTKATLPRIHPSQERRNPAHQTDAPGELMVDYFHGGIGLWPLRFKNGR